jgi:hypothetical protein
MVPAGYRPPAAPATPAAAWTTPQLMSMLQEAFYPSQREWAADRLAALDWRTNPLVVEALLHAAKDDPAATVRACCVHGLVQMNVNTVPVVSAIKKLKDDADPRVRQEVETALASLAPEMVLPAVPSAPSSGPIVPTSASVPAPSR